MRSRLSIVAGLLAGIATAVLVLGGILAFVPEPAPAATPTPQPSVPVASPSVAPTPTPSGAPSTPSASPVPGSSAEASPGASILASAGASPGASGDLGALFGIGEPAPSLVVPQVGGGTIDLATLRGNPVWVNFMGTYCPPCVDEFPLMNGLAARYAEDGLVVVAVDVKEDEGTVAAFASGLGTTFPVGLDRDGEAADRWRASAALPVHFWVDKDGIVRDGAVGGIGPDIMARGVQSIMPDVTVTP